jgi:hypothetical protein
MANISFIIDKYVLWDMLENSKSNKIRDSLLGTKTHCSRERIYKIFMREKGVILLYKVYRADRTGTIIT